MMSIKKEYIGSGIVLVIKFRNQRYYALVKRTRGPGVRCPDTHSGFFGGTDNIEERKIPLLAGCREAYEEVMILNKENRKAAFIILDKKCIDGDKKKNFEKESRRLIKEWKGKIDISNDFSKIKISDKSDIEFKDQHGLKKIWVVEVKLDLEKNILIDCESTQNGTLLDRQIDLFEVNRFHTWLSKELVSDLIADYSYKTGKEIKKEERGFGTKSKINDTLLMAIGKRNSGQ